MLGAAHDPEANASGAGLASRPLFGLSDLYLPWPATIENPLAPLAIDETRETVHDAVALINRQTRDLIALQAQLPRRRRRLDLRVARSVAGMGQLLRGNFDWSLATGRYRTARSPFPELRLPG